MLRSSDRVAASCDTLHWRLGLKVCSYPHSWAPGLTQGRDVPIMPAQPLRFVLCVMPGRERGSQYMVTKVATLLPAHLQHQATAVHQWCSQML